ncbi:DUF1285 domain-containing protein [Brevundimonas sp. 2R-24]|uniref:DUF1285 domain-containing protein n=1 Tax=Peiella sedimenti TaxID=3061083 RepID=A0ABT8SI75_9CAUL|nr:DUF1285 domain-containing protein [Caulobacteraceae bacterium XZ-24]
MSDQQPKGLEGVAAAGRAARGLPPVHLWNPPHCGDIDIVIRADGVWMHEGTPIGRAELVRLFSTVLRKDEDGIYLVTPVEKLKITVEDSPFLAVRVDREGEDLVFTTDVGDQVRAGPENGLRVELGEGDEPRPYLHVRRGLEARLTRPVFYELVEMSVVRGRERGVWSGGVWFPLGDAA